MATKDEILALIRKHQRSDERPLRRDLFALLNLQADYIDQLEGERDALQSAAKMDRVANVQAAFGISETLAELLILLSDGKPRSKSALHSVLYVRQPDSAPDLKILDTLSCKLRKYTTKHGVILRTIWGGSLQITAGLDVLAKAIEGEL